MTSNYDSEWDRVKDNPDNLIVSDSLRDILDPEAFGGTIGVNPKGIRLVSELTFGELGFDSSSPNSWKIVEAAPTADALFEKPKATTSILSGALLSFSRGADVWCYVFEVRAELLYPILMCGPLEKIEVTDQNESFKHEIKFLEDDPEPTVAFELQALSGDMPATSALLTVTVAAPA